MCVVSTNIQNALEICARARKIGIPFIGESDQFLSLVKVVERVARHGDATILVRGETGTGKELIARATHYLGPRADYPFVPVNCGALPDSLLENELFGHCRGAFTDARNDQPGLVQLAEGGTLFLDEIDSLTPRAQVALLRFLEERCFRPLGDNRTHAANVRVVAACNRSLDELCVRGEFRRDLYYRIKIVEVVLPPLRARPGDAVMLAEYFLLRCTARYSGGPRRMHPETLAWIDRYQWPGNVRELENLIDSHFLLCDGEELMIQPCTAGVHSNEKADPPDSTHPIPEYRRAKADAIAHFDREYLARVMAETKGNVTHAARIAGKERRALGKLLKRYKIRSQTAHL